MKISIIFILWLIVSLTPVSASLENSMSNYAADSSLSNAFGVNSTNKSAGSLQVNSENKSSIADILNETASQMDEISNFNGELIDALDNGTEINITNQANQTYGNLVEVHNITELKIGDIVSFRTNSTNSLSAVINLLLVNIADNVFIFKMVNSSNMKSFVNISVNRTELESSWGNNTHTVIRPLQYNETQAEQFILELFNPRNAPDTSGILDYIKEHKSLVSGGAVAVLIITGAILSIVMTCCNKRSTPHATVTVLDNNAPTPLVIKIPNDFLGNDELALSNLWSRASYYYDTRLHESNVLGKVQFDISLSKLEYSNKVYDILKEGLRVKVVRWNKYEYYMRYTTINEFNRVCREIFEDFRPK